MNQVNKTLFIPLYGKARVSRQGIILKDVKAEEIWAAEAFPIKGKSKSKWLTYNMAMRARVFDDWTCAKLRKNEDALVLHIGCGLDSRCCRVTENYAKWLDCDFPAVIALRRKYYAESTRYIMESLDATDQEALNSLPAADCAIIVLEGLSMYLTNKELRSMLQVLGAKYKRIHILMDVYTEFGAKASKYKNPVHDVGVSTLYGVDDVKSLLAGTRIQFMKEYSFTPKRLVDELKKPDGFLFKLMFTGKMYRKIYRLYELGTK